MKKINNNQRTYRLAVLISNAGTGTNLQSIIDAIESKQLNATISVVISDSDSSQGIARAKKHKITTHILSSKTGITKLLTSVYPVDYVVLSGWKKIVSNEMIKAFPDKILNIHPGLIPDSISAEIKNPDGTKALWNRGKFTDLAIGNFLEKKATYAGSSVHFLTSEFDFGPVLGRCFEKIVPGDTVETLYTRLKRKENLLYVEVLQKLCKDSYKKKILIIGSGGREHALGWKLSQSPHVDKIFFAPGNAGTLEIGENVPIAADDINQLLRFAQNKKIDLAVVGGEVPLSLGIVDLFVKNNLLIFGPTKYAAQLECSKVFSAKFMEKYKIPQPNFTICSTAVDAYSALEKVDWEKGIVIKVDGLASGKGVFLPNDLTEATEIVRQIMIERVFNAAGDKIILQEKVSGKEASLLFFCDGEKTVPMIPVQDYKRVFDNDRGLNTGGMGTIAPSVYVNESLITKIAQTVVQPALLGMKKEGTLFIGVLYVGLMLTENDFTVLEFNTRFGDPETQVIMPLLDTDLYEILVSCIDYTLSPNLVRFKNESAVCVVLSSAGYPEKPIYGEEIFGLEKKYNSLIFHAGTKKSSKKIISNGGRVLNSVGIGKSMLHARNNAYSSIGNDGIYFAKMQYRKDIGGTTVLNTDMSLFRIEVTSVVPDMRCQVRKNILSKIGISGLEHVIITDVYTINKKVGVGDIEKIKNALTNPISQTSEIVAELTNNTQPKQIFSYVIEVRFLPGVTDNIGTTVREIVSDLLQATFAEDEGVYSSQMTFLQGDLSRKDAQKIADYLYNPLIQQVRIKSFLEYRESGGFIPKTQQVNLKTSDSVLEVNLHIPDEELIELGKYGIKDLKGRRGPLALDLLYLTAIREYFDKQNRNPTDIELESIAQTWSEHCKHTIFADPIDDIVDGLFNHYIKRATLEIRQSKKEQDICASVFTDNSGAIFFDKDYLISYKVETHNSPSALDPFGGAITGIVGVNRDALGFGLGAKPIANTYGFCLSPPDDETIYFRDELKKQPLLSSRRIYEGVVAGINSGGNCSGIPTPLGFLYFDQKFRGKPLVFAGTLGFIPKEFNNRKLHEKKAKPGDFIVMMGGRVGLDGIHGATFSSEAIDENSPATAVQIGDPITQKNLSDLLITEARDLGLYTSITDNGAGGLSCSVSEMAKESGGCTVELEKVPVKYPGMAPWQIWISESQERMTLSVPPHKWAQLKSLCLRRSVEATVIGTFTNLKKCTVSFNGTIIGDIDLDFLHNGLPKKHQVTNYKKVIHPEPKIPYRENLTDTFVQFLQDINIGSIETISRQYDHEVQGGAALKPLQGKGRVNSDVSVLRPLLDSPAGVLLTQSLYPRYSDIDTYHMAAAAIDSAVRQIVAAGGNINSIALLDNFCWCNSTDPYRLGQLKRAAEACYDLATKYGTPFISGKDSMFNDFKGYDDKGNSIFISIPPTLLISALGIVSDVSKVISIDFKSAEDIIYLIGETFDEIGGSEYVSWFGKNNKYAPGNAVAKIDQNKNRKLYELFTQCTDKGLIASSISVGRGGLGVALAKSAISGQLGFEISLASLSGRTSRSDYALFSESQGRILVSVDPNKSHEFEEILKTLSITKLGKVRGDDKLHISDGNNMLVSTTVEDITKSYKKQFGIMQKLMPKALVLTGYGINCEVESAYAITKGGGRSEIVHINDVLEGSKKLADYEIVVFPGGFAFGDDTGSGNAFALKFKNKLWEDIIKFISDDHLVIGICNGFQILANMGLLPALDKKYGHRQVALLHNDSAVYTTRWVDLEITNDYSPWLTNILRLSLPIAHGEGKFYATDEIMEKLTKKSLIAAKYVRGEMCKYQSLKANPNGSLENIAAITDETGKILGMMPHPERAIAFTHLPHWPYLKEQLQRAGKPIPQDGPGLKIFQNAINYFAT